ncbi:hypothetical protein PQX77_012204 [Marasmius sp. AFHP31]|nr:hypothetical protein PQX77_012204 [Marasmius sp. AFHP31]
MERQVTIRNRNVGSGVQNNNNASGSQYINTGGHIEHMSGGEVNFVESTNPTTINRPRTLWDALSGVGASHTAKQQCLRGSCLPGTREEVLRIIWEWILAGGQGSPILWLAGAAGVGKTAIAMTVAKDCDQKGHLVSSFFFFRSDPKRNVPDALILSIADGLASTMSSMRFFIERRISNDPKILEARLEDQLRELLINSFVRWNLLALCSTLLSVMLLDIMRGFLFILLWFAPLRTPDIVIIDGLDECSDETTQLRVLDAIQAVVQQGSYFPLRFLVCSRPEAWIKEAFAAKPLSDLSKVILLDNKFSPAGDIMQYYRYHFDEVIRSPKYSQVRFPSPWPSEEELVALVHQSCGQFVYAATAVSFIKLAKIPMDQLHLILRSSSNDRLGASPFHALDSLYIIILEANPNPEEVLHILTAILILPGYLEPTPAHIELLYGLARGEVDLALRGMHSVLKTGGWGDTIRVHHNSFREYLLDPNRSHHFHINMSIQTHVIARQWLQNLSLSKVWDYSADQLRDRETKSFFTEWIEFCLLIPKPTRDILYDLWRADVASAQPAAGRWEGRLGEVLNNRDDQNIDHWQVAGRQVNSVARDCVNHFYPTVANHYRVIWGRVFGVKALHEAEQQHKRRQCLPGTREIVLRLIREWCLAREQDNPICWLSGAAGVGKSAIASSIARIYEEERTLIPTLLVRPDSKDNNLSTFCLTIAHGLASKTPAMRSLVEKWFLGLNNAPERDWERALQGFFNDLAGMSSFPNVVIVDGLDEWSDTDRETPLRILSVILSTIQQVPHFPLRFLICSRSKVETFVSNPLFRFTKSIVLDGSFSPDQDIRQYYRYHFREIATSREYSDVRFPSPWPSAEDLEMLVERTCGLFSYASTVIRFIRLASDRPPIDGLRFILKSTWSAPSSDSPVHHNLDCLYNAILRLSPSPQEVLFVLAVILIIPGHLELTAAYIVSLCGPLLIHWELRLRELCSLLDTGGMRNELKLHHISFRDYLVDKNRSHDFHIDIPTHTYAIARQWLANLTISEVRTSDWVYRKQTRSFHVEWISLCTAIPEPTEQLLNDLWNVDLASAYLANGEPPWESMFQSLVPWVMKHQPQNPGIVEGLVKKFTKRPDHFHLEWPCVSPRDDAGHWVVQCAAGCEWTTRLDGLRPNRDQLPRLTDCRCDLFRGDVSRNPKHLAYQDACLRLIKAFCSLFQELAQSDAGDDGTIDELSGIFLNMVRSSLLKPCRLDAGLIRLCRKFFVLAKGCLVMRIDSSDGEKGKKNVFEWIEVRFTSLDPKPYPSIHDFSSQTFPDRFAEDGEALKFLFLALPWERWEQNLEDRQREREEED